MENLAINSAELLQRTAVQSLVPADFSPYSTASKKR
jgi:hypothetical protein